MDHFTHYRLFEGLDPEALDDIAAYARLLDVQRGVVLLEEDTPLHNCTPFRKAGSVSTRLQSMDDRA